MLEMRTQWNYVSFARLADVGADISPVSHVAESAFTIRVRVRLQHHLI